MARKGRHLPPKRIWDEEGQDDAAKKATCNYIRKCLKMHSQGLTCDGKPWVKFNNMTERWLHVQ